MSYFTNFTEKYKKIETHIIKNKDANFISLGLFCPFFFSAYRFCLGDNYTLFQPIYSAIFLERILENVTVLFFFPYLLFFFISDKKPSFYNKIYKKNRYIFIILGFFYRVMFLLSINLFVGCMGVLLLYFLYFYCLFIESNYIYLKTVFIPCIMSFYVFLDNCDRDSYILRKHPNFLYIREQLKKEHYKNNLSLLSKFCLIPTVLFFRLDTHVMCNVIIINNSYNEILQHIEKQVINLDSSEIKKRFIILKDQKEALFQYYCKKHLFLRAAIYIYSPLKKTESFEKFGKKIEDFSISE